MSEALAISKALSPAQLLARLLTVDGINSGLDADLVRGVVVDTSQFNNGPFVGLMSFSVTAIPIRQRVIYPQSLFFN